MVALEVNGGDEEEEDEVEEEEEEDVVAVIMSDVWVVYTACPSDSPTILCRAFPGRPSDHCGRCQGRSFWCPTPP